jgi:hypothetical protein
VRYGSQRCLDGRRRAMRAIRTNYQKTSRLSPVSPRFPRFPSPVSQPCDASETLLCIRLCNVRLGLAVMFEMGVGCFRSVVRCGLVVTVPAAMNSRSISGVWSGYSCGSGLSVEVV